MRRERYLMIVSRREDGGWSIAIETALGALERDGWSRPIDRPWARALVSRGDRAILLKAGGGAIVGPIFRRGSSARLASLAPERQPGPQASRIDDLVRDNWGSYVALLLDPPERRMSIVKAPLGSLPCYFVETDEFIAAASDIDLLDRLGIRQAISWRDVVRHLVLPDLRAGATCIERVEELRGGQSLDISAGAAGLRQAWSPWNFAEAPLELSAPAFERRVRVAVWEAVAAHASDHRQLILKLSGGLDSSIVASALARCGARFTGVTMTTSDSLGDERDYARLVARQSGFPLVEARRTSEGVDIARSSAWRLPRPTARSFAQESARIMEAAADRCGATAVVDGGGGDNVFCALQSAVPLADAVRANGMGLRAWRTVRDINGITGAALLTIARRAIVRAWWTRPDYRWAVDRHFLSAAARRDVPDPPYHPWLAAPDGALPGRAAHVGLIVAAQSWVEGHDPEDRLASLSPLLAQPVVETCLSIPTWHWVAGGINRSLARSAFAGHIPHAVERRRSKGTPQGFVAEIYEANRTRLRDLLLGGMLAGHGLLDTIALDAMVSSQAPLRGNDFLRVMRLADVESWCRAISDRRSPPSRS